MARDIIQGSGAGLRRADRRQDKLTELDAKALGTLSPREGLCGEPQHCCGEPREADRDDRYLVRGGGQVQRSARRRPGHNSELGEPRPQIAEDRTSYTYYPDTQTVPSNAGPNMLNRPYSITVDVEIPKGGAEGVLLSNGGVRGRGIPSTCKSGKLHYVYNYVGSQFFHIESNDAGSGGTPQAPLRV